MTRESRARWLAAATTALVLLLAALFAWLHNLPAGPTAVAAVDVAPAPASAAVAAPPALPPAPAAVLPAAMPSQSPEAAPAGAPPSERQKESPAPVAPAPRSAPEPTASPGGTPPAAERPLPPSRAAAPTAATPAEVAKQGTPALADAQAPAAPAPAATAQDAPAPAEAKPAPPATPAAAAVASAATPSATAVDPARIATGERAYARLGCAMCHSIGGRGNPGSPLDGVGGRLDRKALYELTTGTGAAAAQLGAGLARRKQREVGDADLDALIDYLTQLR